MFLSIIFCIIFIFIHSIEGFNYKQQKKWDSVCNLGISQTPINILEDKLFFDEQLSVKLINFNKPVYDATIFNNGHTVQIDLSRYNKSIQMNSYIGRQFYKVEQLHFHWSKGLNGSVNGFMGSEHSVNGKRYFAEGHFVSYNLKYRSFEKAKNKVDGLLVLAVFYDIVKRNHNKPSQISEFTDLFKRVTNVGDRISSKRLFDLRNLIPSLPRSKGVNYFGSLTTPPCTESVNWVVLLEPVHIDKKDIHAFNLIHLNYNDQFNNRNIQKNNGRITRQISSIMYFKTAFSGQFYKRV